MSNTITMVEVKEVFQSWVAATGRQPGQTKLTPERIHRIFKWLKVGYGVEELKAAMIGVTRLPFYMGENDRGVKYDDLSVVLKSAANIEMFRDVGNGTVTILPTDPVDRRVMDLLKKASDGQEPTDPKMLMLGESGQARIGE